MVVVVDGVVVLGVEVEALIGVPVADNVAETPPAVLLDDVLLEYLAWFIDDEMRRHVDDGFEYILDDLNRLSVRDGKF